MKNEQNRRMKQEGIQRILEIVPTSVWGGGEQYVYEVTRELLREGREVTLFCRTGKNGDRYTLDRMSALSSQSFAGSRVHALPIRFTGKFSLSAYRKTAQTVREGKIELIHTHIFTDAFIALVARKLYRLDTKVIMTRHLAKKAKRDPLHRFIFRNLDRLLFVSKYVAGKFFSGGYPEDGVKWQVNPVALSREKIESARDTDPRLRTRYGIPQDHLIAAYTGRLVEEKAVDLIVEAAINLRHEKITFLLVGKDDGSAYVQRLKRRLEETGTRNVVFAGFTENVMPLIGACDFGLLPTRVEEALSLSALEFLTLGKPMIVTDRGGHSDLIHEGINGYHIHIDDRTALENAILRFLRHPEEMKSMGEAAAKEMQTLDMPLHIQNLLNLL